MSSRRDNAARGQGAGISGGRNGDDRDGGDRGGGSRDSRDDRGDSRGGGGNSRDQGWGNEGRGGGGRGGGARDLHNDRDGYSGGRSPSGGAEGGRQSQYEDGMDDEEWARHEQDVARQIDQQQAELQRCVLPLPPSTLHYHATPCNVGTGGGVAALPIT
jgi:hypothetical protein